MIVILPRIVHQGFRRASGLLIDIPLILMRSDTLVVKWILMRTKRFILLMTVSTGIQMDLIIYCFFENYRNESEKKTLTTPIL